MEVFSNWTESNFRAGSLVRATEDCSLLCIHATRRNRYRDPSSLLINLLEPTLRPQLVLTCNTEYLVRILRCVLCDAPTCEPSQPQQYPRPRPLHASTACLEIGLSELALPEAEGALGLG